MSLAICSNFRRVLLVLQTSCRRCSVRTYCEAPDRDKPVKFSTSEAAGWKAQFSRTGSSYDDIPDAQPFIVSISTGVFLWYFLWYREESDVDNRFNIFQDNLNNTVPDMEEVNLKVLRNKKLSRGESVRGIEERLKELEAARLGRE